MSSFLRESFRLSTSLSCFSSIFVFLWVRIQTKMKPMIPGMKITKLYTALFTALSIPMLSSFWTFLWRREEFDFPRKEFGSLNCQEIQPSNNNFTHSYFPKARTAMFLFFFLIWFNVRYFSTCTVQSWTNSEFSIYSSAIFIGFYVNTCTWPRLMTLTTSGITFIPTLPSRPWGICNMHTQRTETFKSLEVGRVKVQSNHYFFNSQLRNWLFIMI